MKASRALTLKISSAAVISLLIVGYGFFQARNLITGPKINVLTPQNGANLDNPLIVVAGVAENITQISLDDRQIFVDKNGNFSEKLLVSSGYTIIKLAAQDKFGRTAQKLIELNYTGSTTFDVKTEVGTSTATSSVTSTTGVATSAASTATSTSTGTSTQNIIQ